MAFFSLALDFLVIFPSLQQDNSKRPRTSRSLSQPSIGQFPCSDLGLFLILPGAWRDAAAIPGYHPGCAPMLEAHSIVVVSLHTPMEKIWGEAEGIDQAGLTIRGVNVESFDEFVRQARDPEGESIGLPTLFFPMLRIERVALDERRGTVPSLADLFEQRVGCSLGAFLARFG